MKDDIIPTNPSSCTFSLGRYRYDTMDGKLYRQKAKGSPTFLPVEHPTAAQLCACLEAMFKQSGLVIYPIGGTHNAVASLVNQLARLVGKRPVAGTHLLEDDTCKHEFVLRVWKHYGRDTLDVEFLEQGCIDHPMRPVPKRLVDNMDAARALLQWARRTIRRHEQRKHKKEKQNGEAS